VLTAVEKLTRTSLAFDALVRVQDRLAASPPPTDAPAKLVKALDQMSLIYSEIDGAIGRYLTLDFEPPADAKEKKKLIWPRRRTLRRSRGAPLTRPL